jgi:hypothetical protein
MDMTHDRILLEHTNYEDTFLSKPKKITLAQLWPFAVYDQTSTLLINCSFIYCFGGNIKAKSANYFYHTRKQRIYIYVTFWKLLLCSRRCTQLLFSFAVHHIIHTYPCLHIFYVLVDICCVQNSALFFWLWYDFLNCSKYLHIFFKKR